MHAASQPPHRRSEGFNPQRAPTNDLFTRPSAGTRLRSSYMQVAESSHYFLILKYFSGTFTEVTFMKPRPKT